MEDANPKTYKTPSYTRVAVKKYNERIKNTNPDEYKQRRKEANKRYNEKKKQSKTENETI